MAAIQHQISVFDMIEKKQDLDEVGLAVCRGSGYEGGRVRIYAAAVNMPTPEFTEFLKREYGTGGCSMSFGFMDYSGRGILIRKYTPGQREREDEQLLKWPEIARLIRQYIATGYYLCPADESRIKAIRADHDGELPIPHPKMKYE